MRWLMLILFENGTSTRYLPAKVTSAVSRGPLVEMASFATCTSTFWLAETTSFILPFLSMSDSNLKVGEVTALLRPFDGTLGIFFKTSVLRAQVEVVEKGILWMTNVHESSVETGQHLLDPAEVNVPDRIFLVAFVLVKLDQMAVF